MRTLIILLLFTVSLTAGSTEYVYKRVNPDGTIEYSDKPMDGGNVLKVPKGSTFAPLPDVKQGSSAEDESTPQKINYELAIVEPKDDQAIRSNNGNVTFRATLSPIQIPVGYRIVWLLDELEIPQLNGLVAKMKNVDRGTHELQVTIVDNKGDIISSSETITFHILRVSVGG